MKPYHHGNLRPALVDAGVELARADGPDGVVLREVARRTGVSHNAAYRHFADRDELLGEIAGVAAGQLEQAMLRRIDQVAETDPVLRARSRLREVGRAYVEFALAEPGLFAVTFSGSVVDQGRTPPEHEDAGPYVLLGRVLDELVDTGTLSPRGRQGADMACWAAVHGFAVLNLSGPLRSLDPATRERALDVLLTTVERGLTGSVSPSPRSRPTHQSRASATSAP